MPIKSDDLQVIIPYKQLMGLLDASQRVEVLEQKVDRVLVQQDALRCQIVELMEALRELM